MVVLTPSKTNRRMKPGVYILIRSRSVKQGIWVGRANEAKGLPSFAVITTVGLEEILKHLLAPPTVH